MKTLSAVLVVASAVALCFERPGWCLLLASVAFLVYQFLVPDPKP